jgi:hypothetical protein
LVWYNIIGITVLGVAALIQLFPIISMNEALAKSLGWKAFNEKYHPALLRDMASGKTPTEAQRDYARAQAIENAVRLHNNIAYVTMALILIGSILSFE